jgi:hypothetical protein
MDFLDSIPRLHYLDCETPEFTRAEQWTLLARQTELRMLSLADDSAQYFSADMLHDMQHLNALALRGFRAIDGWLDSATDNLRTL